MNRGFWMLAAVFAAVLAVGCSSDREPGRDARDASEVEEGDVLQDLTEDHDRGLTDVLPGGEDLFPGDDAGLDADLGDTQSDTIDPTDPVDLSRRLLSGEVRAGRVEKSEDLLEGPYTQGRIGDYKLYNSKVAFVVQDRGVTSVYRRYGGMPIDADIIRPVGEPGGSQLGDLFLGFNLRLFEPQSVEVLSNGHDGEARIRLVGRDGDFPWLASFLGFLMPPAPLELQLIYDYSLGPDDDYLTLTVTAVNHSEFPVDINLNAVAFLISNGLKSHFPGPGFDANNHSGRFPYWTALGARVSYGFLLAGSAIDMFMNYSNISFGTIDGFYLPPGGSDTFVRYLAVLEGGVDRVQQRLNELSGRPNGVLVAGVVQADAEALRRGVRVHISEDQGQHRTTALASNDGTFSTFLVPGVYRLFAKADGYHASPETTVVVSAEGAEFVQLDLAPSTPFLLSVVDENGSSIPARILFLPKTGGPLNVLSPMYGEERYGFGAVLEIHSGTGTETGVVPRGDYRVWAMRGIEYERQMTEVTAGEEVLDLSFVLDRVVDSSGYLSTDLHVHGIHSPDSEVPEDVRARTGLAEGLDLILLTEHDSVYDVSDALSEIPGAFQWGTAVAGSEITTYVYGHFNAFPLTPKPGQVGQGFIEWFGLGAPDLFQRIRASEPYPVIIMANHPRGSDLGSYFSAVGKDIATGTVKNWDNWSSDFDAIEVFNGGCRSGQSEVLQDWFAMLNRGYHVSVGAGSDTHSDKKPLGIPRTYVSSASSLQEFSVHEITSAFYNLDVFVSCGPFVRFSIAGTGMGGLVTHAEDLVAHVTIQAPSWMTLSDLRILRNGQVEVEIPAAQWSPGSGAIRHAGLIPLVTPDLDSWYVLEVRGSGSMHPFSGDVPYAITNPVFVDIDGNEQFDPPLPPYAPAAK